MAFHSFFENLKLSTWLAKYNAASNIKYDTVQSNCRPRQAPGIRRQIWAILAFDLGIFILYSGAFCYAVRNMMLNRHEIGLIYSPARSVVSYESRYLDLSTPWPFNQPPSLEVDVAWHQLLKYNNVMLQEEDLAQINKTSVLLRDKSAYLGGLDVFHELHCLNYIRENVYADYYALEPGKFRTEHLYHCIDHLREILMCHGDIAVHTYEWGESTRYPLMKQQTLHECRKWDPIVTWAQQHDPAALPMPILEHPQLGIIEPMIHNETQA